MSDSDSKPPVGAGLGLGRIYKSPYPDLDIPQTSLFSYLLPLKDEHAHLPALIDSPTGTIINRADLQRDARQLAYGIRNGLSPSSSPSSSSTTKEFLNIPRYGTLLIFSGNSTLVPLVMLAGLCGGITVSMASSLATPSELKYQIEDSGPSHIFVQPALLGTALAALKLIGVDERDLRRRVVLIERGGSGEKVSVEARDLGLLTLDDLMVDKREFFPEDFSGEKSNRTAMLFYSSGTTGLPKGVELSHYNLVASTASMNASEHIVSEPGVSPRIYGPLPMFHVYGGVIMMFYPLIKKLPIIVTAGFEPDLFLSTIQRYKVTHLFIAPPIGAFLANTPLLSKYDITSLKSITSSAAALSPVIIDAMRGRFASDGVGIKRIHIGQGFGATEMSPGISNAPHLRDHKPASSGVLFAGIEARLVDDDGKDVPEGEPGELIVRGPNMMKGYLNKPEATRNTIKDGWLYTGDIAVIDDEGFVWIVDRKKELIKYSGYQVSPVEVENVLFKHPGVADATVVGVKDIRTGNELPRAYIVPRDTSLLEPGASTKAEAFKADITSFVKERVSQYKQLRGGVILTPSIPKTAAGKILRRQLRAEIEKEQQALVGKAKL